MDLWVFYSFSMLVVVFSYLNTIPWWEKLECCQSHLLDCGILHCAAMCISEDVEDFLVSSKCAEFQQIVPAGR